MKTNAMAVMVTGVVLAVAMAVPAVACENSTNQRGSARNAPCSVRQHERVPLPAYQPSCHKPPAPRASASCPSRPAPPACAQGNMRHDRGNNHPGAGAINPHNNNRQGNNPGYAGQGNCGRGNGNPNSGNNNGNGGTVNQHDDNGHGNDAGHTDPSNPGQGNGNHGTRQNSNRGINARTR